MNAHDRHGAVDIDAKIPNNVDLAGDRRLQRALESWQPKFIDWWKELGPVAFRTTRCTCAPRSRSVRRAGRTSTTSQMPEYRWGIFLAEPGARPPHRVRRPHGEPVWQEVPGEYRAELRRLLVVQGDTEPASVEQQRHLCLTAPSLYDLRNLFQVNVEEGRHLWAMVYLLHRYFGRDGRDEADEMLERHSGDADKPRILGAFNEPTPDWLSFFMFTYFTDRDGKYQLASLRESAFDPLSRTCDFMLKEEAHHMFVGATGVGRVVERTVELMKEHDTDDVRPHGGIDVATLQRYLNFHYAVSLDLFGAETSTNAANYFAAGLKGRFQEERRDDDHRLHGRDAHGARGDRRRDRRARGDRAGGAERDAPRRLRRRLPEGRRSLEPRARRGRRIARAPPRRLQPRRRHVREPPRVAPTAGCHRRRVARQRRLEWLPTDDDRSIRRVADGRCPRTGEDGRLGRPAVDGDSCRSRSTSSTSRSDHHELIECSGTPHRSSAGVPRVEEAPLAPAPRRARTTRLLPEPTSRVWRRTASWLAILATGRGAVVPGSRGR